MEDFATQISDLRSKLQLSQEELATRLGVSFATVNRWESGKSRPQRAQRDAVERLLAEAGAESDSSSPPDTSPTTRRRRGISHSKVLGTRSMEQMLWDAACSIRGEKDAPKFKDYILPLLFIKRLSDVFDDELARLAEQFGDRDTALALVEEEAKGTTQPSQRLVRLYIPPEARWGVVSGRVAFDWPADRRPRTLGEQLTLTTRAIVRHNPGLAGVIDVVDFNETRNGEREISDGALKGVIETFSDPRYRLGLHDVEPDFLGRCYEYLLRKFAEGSGQSAGEFFTPTEVGFLMAEVLRPRPGEQCCDFACGSFGLLVKLQLVCRRLDPLSKVPLRLYGQELQAESYAVSCMNRIIHDMQGEVVRGDSMRNPKFRESDSRLKQFDIVVANPMWNQPFDPDVYEHDPFGRFDEQGGTTAGRADWAWLQHTLQQERGSRAQHPSLVRGTRLCGRRDPPAGQSLLQHHCRRGDRRVAQRKTQGAAREDRPSQREWGIQEGESQELPDRGGNPADRGWVRCGTRRGRLHQSDHGGGRCGGGFQPFSLQVCGDTGDHGASRRSRHPRRADSPREGCYRPIREAA